MKVWRRLRTYPWFLRLLWLFLIALPLGVAAFFAAIQVSSQPAFCGTCHYMHPYYQSWQTSTHKDVACVECHIAPGIVSELQKKFEALSMVVSYFTGTYGTRPWGEVPDAACLRPGCHEKRLLLGKELFNGVLFDHRPHLTELPRGKQLRCTSCHSQIVQGKHIAVTASTCFLCHFKETALNQGTALCTLCHQVPERTITISGISFNHSDVKRFGMNCLACHQGVVSGQGNVPQERCLTCHNEPSRLARYGDSSFLHTVHVTEHHVDCLNCHNEILHQVPEQLQAVTTSCQTCHEARHSLVRDLYLGVGGQGVPPQPNPMYVAGVSCDACHILPQSSSRRANEVSCMSCHGTKYLTIYRSWQAALTQRLQGLQAALSRVQSEAQRAGKPTGALIQQAQQNIEFVAQANGVHNPDYALAILEKAYQDLSAAAQSAGQGVLARPWLQAPYRSDCLQCHYGIEYLNETIFGRNFSHQTHVVETKIQCTICHGERQTAHGTLRLQSAADCDRCHSQLTGVPSPKDCLNCHTAQITVTSEKVRFPHEQHIQMGFPCSLCHQGVDQLPHGQFARSPEALPQLGHAFCAKCHAADLPPKGQNCTRCHLKF